MSQPASKRKSLGATGRNILRAISNKQSRHIKSNSAGSPPRIAKSEKRRRTTHGSADTNLQSPPASPYKQPKASTPTIVGKDNMQRRSVSRSFSEPGRSTPISSASAPVSSRTGQDLAEFRTPAKVTKTTTTTTTANSASTPSYGRTSTALSTSTESAKVTSTMTTTTTLTATSTPRAFAVPTMSPPVSGASKQVRPSSSPTRIKESAYSKWKIEAREKSDRYLGAIGMAPSLPPAADQGSNSSNVRESPSDLMGQSAPQVQKRRSIRRSQGNTYRQEKEPRLPYPKLIGELIGEAHYAKLPRPAQLMMTGVGAAMRLHLVGKETFGAEWSWKAGTGATFPNWGLPGENPAADYIDGPIHFKRLYEKGELARYFEGKIKTVELMAAGPERAASISKLAMQATHVLNLALEDLRLLTLRTDVSTKMICVYWDAMTKAKPQKNDLELLAIYLGNRCVTVQAFANALRWLVKTVSECMIPQPSESERTKSLHALGSSLLGYPYESFQRAQVHTGLGRLAEAVQVLNLSEALATRRANRMGEQNQQPNWKDVLLNRLESESRRFVQLLVAGDQRFLQAAGLDAITDPPTVLQTMEPAAPRFLSPQPLPQNQMEPVANANELPELPAFPTGFDQ